MRPQDTAAYPQGPELHQRGAGESAIVYPVVSRRSRGLSLGINLFPDRKVCTYHCSYCEVPAFSNPEAALTPGMIEAELRRFFASDWSLYGKYFELKDICISGNGEPTCSPFFEECLRTVMQLRQQAVLPLVPTVLITNSTGFLRDDTIRLIQGLADALDLKVWAKLDGGNARLHALLSGSSYAYETILAGIVRVSSLRPLILQTMILTDSRSGQILFDAGDYAMSIRNILDSGGKLEAIQLYTLARTPAEPWPRALADEEMCAIAFEVTNLIGSSIRIECFGSKGELTFIPALDGRANEHR